MAATESHMPASMPENTGVPPVVKRTLRSMFAGSEASPAAVRVAEQPQPLPEGETPVETEQGTQLLGQITGIILRARTESFNWLQAQTLLSQEGAQERTLIHIDPAYNRILIGFGDQSIHIQPNFADRSIHVEYASDGSPNNVLSHTFQNNADIAELLTNLFDITEQTAGREAVDPTLFPEARTYLLRTMSIATPVNTEIEPTSLAEFIQLAESTDRPVIYISHHDGTLQCFINGSWVGITRNNGPMQAFFGTIDTQGEYGVKVVNMQDRSQRELIKQLTRVYSPKKISANELAAHAFTVFQQLQLAATQPALAWQISNAINHLPTDASFVYPYTQTATAQQHLEALVDVLGINQQTEAQEEVQQPSLEDVYQALPPAPRPPILSRRAPNPTPPTTREKLIPQLGRYNIEQVIRYYQLSEQLGNDLRAFVQRFPNDRIDIRYVIQALSQPQEAINARQTSLGAQLSSVMNDLADAFDPGRYTHILHNIPTNVVAGALMLDGFIADGAVTDYASAIAETHERRVAERDGARRPFEGMSAREIITELMRPEDIPAKILSGLMLMDMQTGLSEYLSAIKKAHAARKKRRSKQEIPLS